MRVCRKNTDGTSSRYVYEVNPLGKVEDADRVRVCVHEDAAWRRMRSNNKIIWDCTRKCIYTVHQQCIANKVPCSCAHCAETSLEFSVPIDAGIYFTEELDLIRHNDCCAYCNAKDATMIDTYVGEGVCGLLNILMPIHERYFRCKDCVKIFDSLCVQWDKCPCNIASRSVKGLDLRCWPDEYVDEEDTAVETCRCPSLKLGKMCLYCQKFCITKEEKRHQARGAYFDLAHRISSVIHSLTNLATLEDKFEITDSTNNLNKITELDKRHHLTGVPETEARAELSLAICNIFDRIKILENRFKIDTQPFIFTDDTNLDLSIDQILDRIRILSTLQTQSEKSTRPETKPTEHQKAKEDKKE